MRTGRLISDPPEHFDGRLPAPPFLMVDRILSIQDDGRQGTSRRSRISGWTPGISSATCREIRFSPGVCAWTPSGSSWGFIASGAVRLVPAGPSGAERLLSTDRSGPYNKTVRYEIDVRRYSQLKESGASIIIGDGKVFVDDELIAEIQEARTGIFKDIAYKDYPKRSLHSIGGIMR